MFGFRASGIPVRAVEIAKADGPLQRLGRILDDTPRKKRARKEFFESKLLSGWKMNHYGVCYNDVELDEHLSGHNRIQLGNVAVTDQIQAEAREAGCTSMRKGREIVWSQRNKQSDGTNKKGLQVDMQAFFNLSC